MNGAWAYALGLLADLIVVAGFLFATSVLMVAAWCALVEVVGWNEQRSQRARRYRASR